MSKFTVTQTITAGMHVVHIVSLTADGLESSYYMFFESLKGNQSRCLSFKKQIASHLTVITLLIAVIMTECSTAKDVSTSPSFQHESQLLGGKYKFPSFLFFDLSQTRPQKKTYFLPQLIPACLVKLVFLEELSKDL